VPTPNADDPLRTTAFAPEMAKASPSVAGKTTSTFQPKQAESTDGPSTTPSEPPLPAIPGYALEGILGRGGMGVVYKARHLALKRTVALKMVLAAGHAGPRERARFRIEADAVARLQHPNIVQIHEVGEAGGHPYCALEFVEGGTLRQRRRRSGAPPTGQYRNPSSWLGMALFSPPVHGRNLHPLRAHEPGKVSLRMTQEQARSFLPNRWRRTGGQDDD
jgi:serine/threonine protein kinase